ncbi:hypothetical protein B0H14DRAFT_2592364 [Mycena olivaceomarginata]|nr:hypothetical protein B0H14DRAFT_2592364 [Mycena olivaceomarginata]
MSQTDGNLAPAAPAGPPTGPRLTHISIEALDAFLGSHAVESPSAAVQDAPRRSPRHATNASMPIPSLPPDASLVNPPNTPKKRGRPRNNEKQEKQAAFLALRDRANAAGSMDDIATTFRDLVSLMRDYRKTGPTAACFESLNAVHARLEAAHEFPRDAESPESFSAILTKSVAAPLQAQHKALQSLTKSIESAKSPRPDTYAAATAATFQPPQLSPKTVPVTSTPEERILLRCNGETPPIFTLPFHELVPQPSLVTLAPPLGTRIASDHANSTDDSMFRKANRGCKRAGDDLIQRRKQSLQDGHYAGQNCKINLFSQTLCDCGAFSCPCPKPEFPCPTDVMGAGNCGKGLFSRGRIAQQTFVIEYAGNRIGSEQKDEFLAQGCVYIFQVAPREFVDASKPNEVNLARHINHSCDPNAVVELWNDTNGLPRALVISKRTIFPGVTSSSAGGKASNTEISRAHDGLRGPSFGQLDDLPSFSNDHYSITHPETRMSGGGRYGNFLRLPGSSWPDQHKKT